MEDSHHPSPYRTRHWYPVFHRLAYLLLLTGCLSMLGGCDAVEFSPNQISDRNSPTDLNARNLQKLLANSMDDTVTVALTGDSQRFYKHVDRFVDKANRTPGIDLILLAGDISDFGMLQEFEWVNDRLSRLDKPYFGVVGNHDLVANGKNVFRKMFGPLNFSFTYGGVKFVAHDTNNLEYGEEAVVPNLDWLRKELEPQAGVDFIVPVSHVPPFSLDQFSEDLVRPYTTLFRDNPRVLMSLHGHVHQHLDYFPFDDGVRYITGFSYQQDAFVVLKIIDGKVFKTIVNY